MSNDDLADVTARPFFWRCEKCDGSRKDPRDGKSPCRRCGGEGTGRVRYGKEIEGEGK